jgi:hypothetical protein
MLYVFSAKLKTGRWEEFTKWLDGNHDRLAKAQPAGWSFRGAYLTVWSLGGNAVEFHYGVENYAAFDTAREVAHQRGEYHKVLTELHSYLEAPTGEARLLAPATKHAASNLGLKGAPRFDAIIVGC